MTVNKKKIKLWRYKDVYFTFFRPFSENQFSGNFIGGKTAEHFFKVNSW
jgi:hypothetical protein